MRPLAWTFYGSFAVAALWYAPRTADATLARFEPPPPRETLATADWWTHGMLDARRFDIEIAGPLQPLQQRLQAQGWQLQPEADWMSVLGLLDDDNPAQHQPVLPVALDARREAMVLRRAGERADTLQVLRIWPAPARLVDDTSLWVARFETMQVRRPLRLLMLWKPLPATDGLPTDVDTVLATFPHIENLGRMRVRTSAP
jgi:hypothetical protein